MLIHYFGLFICVLNGLSQSEALQCPHPDADVNSKVETTSLGSGSTATYSCDAGYELFGSSLRTCGNDGSWTGELPVCATNVAWRKPVNQSSTVRGGAGENANDGDKTTLHDGNKCTQTTTEESPWWSVDLLQVYEIAVVRIITRGCCEQEAVQDLEVRVGDSIHLQHNRLCAWHPGTIEKGATIELKCARPMKGRYLFVQMVGVVGSLSLCEVEVFSKEELSKDRCKGDVDVSKLGLFNQTCYEFQVSSGGTFQIARDYCTKRRQGSLVYGIQPLTHKYLVSELERLQPEMQSKMLWIGAQKEPQFVSRTWRWIDGTKVEKPNWGKEQPNNYNGEQTCVVIDGSRDWLWNDVGCNLNYLNWMCQFQPSCGTPDRNLNITLTVEPHGNGSIVTYTCPEGNKVEGDAKRNCLPSGHWSGEAPTCKYIDCGIPPSIEQGVFSLLNSRTTYSAKAKYVCAENYTMDGNETILCGNAGIWEPAAPKCLYSWCPEIENPQNAILEISGRRSGDTATFECSPGYFLVGHKTISCALGGTWSGVPPTCHFVDCGLPEALPNGKMTLVNSTTHAGSVSVYKCEEDYWLEGSSNRICENTGHWSGDRPTCTRIDCGEPEIPVGGYVTGYSFEVHSEVEYHCEVGHFMTGDSRTICTQEGQWTGETPTCTYVDCGRPLPLAKGELIFEDDGEPTFLNSRVHYKCMPTYRLIGEELRVCSKNGQWSGDNPACEEIRCGEPERPPKSRISVAGNNRGVSLAIPRARNQLPTNTVYRVGSQITYRCDRGYIVDGSNIRTCLENGTWSNEPPSCQYVDCGLPPPIEKGVYRLLSNETSYGAVVSYECEENWKVEGKLRSSCQENGMWSESNPACIEVLCSSLSEELQNKYKEEDERETETWNKESIATKEKNKQFRIFVEDGERRIGSIATYKCKEGQKVIGEQTRICKQHGIWGGTEPKCEWIHCERPRDITNGRVHLLNEHFAYNTVVEYFCLPNYFLNGPFNRTCTLDGTWSGVDPKCTLDDINLSVFGDNTIDGTSNSPRGPLDASVSGASYTGIYVGVAVSFILALAVGLALLFFKTRENKAVKTQASNTSTKPMDTSGSAVMTYGDLNDPSTGNNIYEHIPDDIDASSYTNMSPANSFTSTPPASYSNYPPQNTYSNDDSHLTYTNSTVSPMYNDRRNNFERGYTPTNGKIPPHISKRPRMPPPQPPQVPPPRVLEHSLSSSVTVNGVSVNTSS